MRKTSCAREANAVPFVISREQRLIFREAAAFSHAAERFGPVLRRTAGRMKDVDPDLADDLVQEALIRLWELGPSRYEPRDDVYLRTKLIGRMRDVRRKYARRARRCNLRIR